MSKKISKIIFLFWKTTFQTIFHFENTKWSWIKTYIPRNEKSYGIPGIYLCMLVNGEAYCKIRHQEYDNQSPLIACYECKNSILCCNFWLHFPDCQHISNLKLLFSGVKWYITLMIKFNNYQIIRWFVIHYKSIIVSMSILE